MNVPNHKKEELAKIAAKLAAEVVAQAERQQLTMSALASEPICHKDHRMPKTRRELLSTGFLSGMAYAIIPSIFTFQCQQAFAAPVCSPVGANDPKAARPSGYLHIELSGGAALSGNFMIGKQPSGDFVPLSGKGYASLGLGTSQVPGKVNLDSSIQGQFHPASSFLAGLKSVMSPEAMAKTVAVGMAGTSADDNSNNPLNPTQLVARVNGLQGSLVQIVGNGDRADTLGRTAALAIGQDSGLSKAKISTEASLTNLVNPGLIANRFNRMIDAPLVTTDLAHKLSASKLAQIPVKIVSQSTKDLIECGYLGAKDLLNIGANSLTPSTDPLITGKSFNALNFATLNKNNAPSQNAMIMTKMLTDGLASCATVEDGGYDYHGAGRDKQDAKDFIAGQTAGIALEIAHRKSSALFIGMTSDGSVSSNGDGGANDRFNFTGDNGNHGMVLMLAIGAKARPATSTLQIGAYNDAGAVNPEIASLTSRTPAAQALCLAYNYAAFTGRLGEFDKVMAALGSPNPFKGSEATYQAFQAKA